MRLSGIVTEERVGLVPPSRSLDKRQSLLELARLLSTAVEAPEADLLAILEEREALQSTGIGDGVAVPHGTLERATGQVGALLVCPGGVDFDSIDDKPAKILFGVVGPKQAVEHIKVLARVSRILRNGALRDRLLAAADPRAIYSLLEGEDDAIGG